MAKSFAKIHVIAVTAFEETMRRRVFYVVAILAVLIGAITAASTLALRMAMEAGETEIASTVSTQIVESTIGVWQTAAMFLAIFLGAVAVSSEITAKTIVNILSRPVERAAYLTGRWVGILLFLWAFQLIGILAAVAVARLYDVRLVPTIWLGFAEMFVDGALLSGVSLGLSTVMPPVLAGGCTILLQIMPGMIQPFLQNPRWLVRLPVFAAYYLAPAHMPVNLIGDSFSKQLLHPEYGLYSRVLIENLLYAVALFALGCIAFTRREARLR